MSVIIYEIKNKDNLSESLFNLAKILAFHYSTERGADHNDERDGDLVNSLSSLFESERSWCKFCECPSDLRCYGECINSIIQSLDIDKKDNIKVEKEQPPIAPVPNKKESDVVTKIGSVTDMVNTFMDYVGDKSVKAKEEDKIPVLQVNPLDLLKITSLCDILNYCNLLREVSISRDIPVTDLIKTTYDKSKARKDKDIKFGYKNVLTIADKVVSELRKITNHNDDAITRNVANVGLDEFLKFFIIIARNISEIEKSKLNLSESTLGYITEDYTSSIFNQSISYYVLKEWYFSERDDNSFVVKMFILFTYNVYTSYSRSMLNSK